MTLVSDSLTKNLNSFSVISHGKWILAGEHSVLRGSPALIFPLYSRKMAFRYKKTSSVLDFKYQGAESPISNYLFSVVLEKIKLDLKWPSSFVLKGDLEIENDIPFGEGLGASAAFCVNIAKWLCFLDLLKEKDVFSFAKYLEEIFHGESSGGDISVALEKRGVRFERSNQNWKLLKPLWTPCLYLSHSGKKSLTSYSVNQVKKWIAKNPLLGKKIDNQMKQSVEMAEKSLMQKFSENSLQLMKKSIELAQDCFKEWGLAQNEVEKEIKSLLDQGALAAKPTGAGGGGFVLSLWKDSSSLPSSDQEGSLIPCFEKESKGMDRN